MKSEENARKILNDWIEDCRCKNLESNKVELKDVSNWVEKHSEINENCPDLDKENGIFLFFCLGSMLNYRSGNYKRSVGELRNKYQSLLSRDFATFISEKQEIFTEIDKKLEELKREFGSDKFLQEWWNDKKKRFNGNLENAASDMLKEIHSWKLPSSNKPFFTVKTIWIARELHANRVWPDFPVKYCCIPDTLVRRVLAEKIYTKQKFKELFGRRFNQPFEFESGIKMSKKIWELVSKEKVDGHYPYDMPFFRDGYGKKKNN